MWKKIQAVAGVASFLWGSLAQLIYGVKFSNMLEKFDPHTYNAIVAAISIEMNFLLIGLGFALLSTLVVPFFYDKWKSYISKTHTVPFVSLISYIMNDSILCESFKAEETIKDAIEITKAAAKEKALTFFAREKKSNQYKSVPAKFFGLNAKIELKRGELYTTAILKNPTLGEDQYIGITVNENDMLKLWPPHDHSFQTPLSWIKKNKDT